MFQKDASLQDKSNKLGSYVLVRILAEVLYGALTGVQDHVKPVVDEIYGYVLGAKVCRLQSISVDAV